MFYFSEAFETGHPDNPQVVVLRTGSGGESSVHEPPADERGWETWTVVVEEFLKELFGKTRGKKPVHVVIRP